MRARRLRRHDRKQANHGRLAAHRRDERRVARPDLVDLARQELLGDRRRAACRPPRRSRPPGSNHSRSSIGMSVARRRYVSARRPFTTPRPRCPRPPLLRTELAGLSARARGCSHRTARGRRRRPRARCGSPAAGRPSAARARPGRARQRAQPPAAARASRAAARCRAGHPARARACVPASPRRPSTSVRHTSPMPCTLPMRLRTSASFSIAHASLHRRPSPQLDVARNSSSAARSAASASSLERDAVRKRPHHLGMTRGHPSQQRRLDLERLVDGHGVEVAVDHRVERQHFVLEMPSANAGPGREAPARAPRA